MPLSYSQLRLYQVCPRQYEFAVIKKLSRPITPAESFGSSVHNTLKKWGEAEIRYQTAESREQQSLFGTTDNADTLSSKNSALTSDFCSLTSDRLRELWHQTFSPDVYRTRMEADFARRRGERIMEHFFQWWSQQPRTVLAVEKGFSLAIDGLTLTGRLDRVEQEADGIHVIDFKTSPPRNQKEADADLQLSIYAIAVQQEFKKPCTKLSFLFLSEDACGQRTTERSENQLHDARKQILALHSMMQGRNFHPTPSVEKCKRCPYRNVCDAAAI